MAWFRLSMVISSVSSSYTCLAGLFAVGLLGSSELALLMIDVDVMGSLSMPLLYCDDSVFTRRAVVLLLIVVSGV